MRSMRGYRREFSRQHTHPNGIGIPAIVGMDFGEDLRFDSKSFHRALLPQVQKDPRSKMYELPPHLDLALLAELTKKVTNITAFREIVDEHYVQFQHTARTRYFFEPTGLDVFLQDWGTPLRRLVERAYLVTLRLQWRSVIRQIKRRSSAMSNSKDPLSYDTCIAALRSLRNERSFGPDSRGPSSACSNTE